MSETKKVRPNPEASYKTGRRGNSIHHIEREERHRFAVMDIMKSLGDLSEPCYWAEKNGFDGYMAGRTAPLAAMDARIAKQQAFIETLPENQRAADYGRLEIMFRVRRLFAELDKPEK